MSSIEFAEELNQTRHRFWNTGAMTAKAAELAFVRCAVASSVLGRARALVFSGLLACAVAAQADNAERRRERGGSSIDSVPNRRRPTDHAHRSACRHKPTTTSGPRTGLGDGNHTSATPVGLGLGKVIQLDAGYTLNTYAEIQPSLYRSGVGAPNYQVFTGISLQLPLYFTSGWHLF